MAKTSDNKAALKAAGGIVKQTAKESTSKAAAPKQNKRAEKRECLICADSKTSRGYQPPKDGEICEHFRSICRACVQKLVKSKITDDNLGEGVLQCPFGDCGHEVAFSTVGQMVTTGTFENWDQALLRRYLRDTEDLTPCLNPKCGFRFSVEDCNVKSGKGRKKMTCPYCEFDFCIRCSRAWHPKATCDQKTMQARKEEEEQSEKEMKRMGAQPCPHCGIKIEKDGGCSHMFCKRNH
ncbi:hypothetical protein BDV96DRAFT_669153 [Lophiotrema nucula]|uniref:RBR-type E3 ubiquitin transferase n=1 Tax=Lophiotrema nucula TaxID=690887 RepID=A0A6A5YU25_9PLEO|nr:hypothetical protein BDV96DRAFT_669153 [Lophiotrema nucula]